MARTSALLSLPPPLRSPTLGLEIVYPSLRELTADVSFVSRALDIFGGLLVSFDALVILSKESAAWNEQNGFAL